MRSYEIVDEKTHDVIGTVCIDGPQKVWSGPDAEQIEQCLEQRAINLWIKTRGDTQKIVKARIVK